MTGGDIVVRYQRATHERDGHYRDREGWDEAHRASEGLVHMLRPDRLMTVGEVCAEAQRYNEQWGKPDAFPSEPGRVEECLEILADAGMVDVCIDPHGGSA